MRDATDPVSFGQAMLGWSDRIAVDQWKPVHNKVVCLPDTRDVLSVVFLLALLKRSCFIAPIVCTDVATREHK